MMHRLLYYMGGAAAIVVVAALAGCYESPDVTLSDPGQYNGKTDPLLAKLEGTDLQDKLGQRFENQTDR